MLAVSFLFAFFPMPMQTNKTFTNCIPANVLSILQCIQWERTLQIIYLPFAQMNDCMRSKCFYCLFNMNTHKLQRKCSAIEWENHCNRWASSFSIDYSILQAYVYESNLYRVMRMNFFGCWFLISVDIFSTQAYKTNQGQNRMFNFFFPMGIMPEMSSITYLDQCVYFIHILCTFKNWKQWFRCWMYAIK